MKRISAKKSKTSITPSSENVFADLQLPEAEEKQTKVGLAVTINQIIESSSFSQAAASEVLRVNQPKISALANYRLDGFSVERLMNFLNALGRDIEIVIRKAPGRRAPKIRVTAA
ncbi:MAG TPA: helix-turn-helix transcriptional regulator [Candidatus Angelobacter sp.]|jgi:predicted XRE-type DNA-binding protein